LALQENPAHEFGWSSRAFQHACLRQPAEVAVGKEVLDLSNIQAGDEYDRWSDLHILQEVKRLLKQEVLNVTKYPARSTSVQSNLMEQEMLAARAKMLETVERYLAWR
jgi:hypothetical protein